MPYIPDSAPQAPTLDELRMWMEEELERMARVLNETLAVDLRPINAEPTRPRDGMIIYADGTNFDPGAGEGVYAREAGAWVKL